MAAKKERTGGACWSAVANQSQISTAGGSSAEKRVNSVMAVKALYLEKNQTCFYCADAR